MTMRIGGNSNNYENLIINGGTSAPQTNTKTADAPQRTAAAQTQQTPKPPTITDKAVFTVVNCKTEQQLARAGLMAAAAKAGIGNARAQAAFADRVLAKGALDLQYATTKTDISDKNVGAMNNKQYTFVLDKNQKADLAQFRSEYVAAGNKLVYATNPRINAQQTATTNVNAVADPNQPKNIKVKVTLPNTGEPLADRALLGYAQQKYGQPKTNLWGDNIRNIRDLSKLQGVAARNIKTAQMGDKTVAEFELTPSDAAKMQRSYEAEQTEFNRVQEIADKFRNNNEAAAFLRGFGNGVWSALKSNWEMIKDPIGTAKSLFQMVTNPIETLEGIKNLIGDKWTEFQNADPSKKAEMLGQIAGELAVDALLTKGAGKVAKLSKAAEMLRGTKIGESILSKADDVAAAAKARVAATFSDEAAAAASQRIKQRLATQLYSGIPADLLADMAVVAGNKVSNGVSSFAEFSRQMVQDFGEKVRPELRKLFDQAVDKVTGGRRDVDVHELLGGHTIEKHVGKNEKFLRERLKKELDIDAASTFYNKDLANRAQMQIVKEFGKEIDEWAKNSKSNFPIKRTTEMNQDVGVVLERGKGGTQVSSKVEAIIVKDKTERGWHILTAYPIPE